MNKIKNTLMASLLYILSSHISLAYELNHIYINQAHTSNLNKCDNLINKNFDIFNRLESNKYQLYHDAIGSLSKDIKTIRYYFSYGTLEEVSFGDLTVIQTPTECQSFLQVSMKFDNQKCSVVTRYKKGEWVFDEQHDLVKWYINKNNNYGNIMPINNFKGCLFKYYKTDVQTIATK